MGTGDLPASGGLARAPACWWRLSLLVPAPRQCCLCLRLAASQSLSSGARGTPLQLWHLAITAAGAGPFLPLLRLSCDCHMTLLLVDLGKVAQEELWQGQGFRGC